MVKATRTRLRMGRFDPQSTLSVMMQVKDTIHPSGYGDDDFVYFQFITRYLNPNDVTDLVTRVVSQKIPILIDELDENNDFFHSLNENILPTLLCKEAAFRCMVKPDDDSREGSDKTAVVEHEDVEYLVLQAQKDLDTTVNRISGAYFHSKESR